MEKYNHTAFYFMRFRTPHAIEIYAFGCDKNFLGTDDVFEYQNKLKN
jgi:hypothetical protein